MRLIKEDFQAIEVILKLFDGIVPKTQRAAIQCATFFSGISNQEYTCVCVFQKESVLMPPVDTHTHIDVCTHLHTYKLGQ